MYLGGAININTDETTMQAVMLEILSDTETRIIPLTMNPRTPAYLFTIEFNVEKFAKFFNTLLPGTTIPKVLLLKLMAYEYETYSSNAYTINNNEFYNEITQHKKLSSYDNIFPICPSFLYDEKICSSGNYTHIGEVIKGLLNNANLYLNYTKDVVKKLQDLIEERKGHKLREHISMRNVSQHIVIMEYYSCQTLSSFLKSRVTPEISNIVLYGKLLQSMIPDEFSSFMTLFVTTLMLERGFIHGDLHRNNILICIDNNNITPVVIDFGRTFALNSRDFKFDNKIIELLMRNREIRLSYPIRDIVERTFDVLSAPLKTSINEYIRSLLDEKLFVEASIVSSMCCTLAFNHSAFYFFIRDPPEQSSYKYMYYCKENNVDIQESVWYDYDILFLQLLKARKLLTRMDYLTTKIDQFTGKSKLMTSLGLLTRGTKAVFDRLTSGLMTKRNAGKQNKLKKIKAKRNTRRKSRR